MLPMSLKSVPGCLTLIEPTGIGVPVAATPGFVPQLDVPLDEPLDAVVVLVDDEPEAAGALLEVLLLLLLLLLEPHAARASSARTPTSATPNRARPEPWSILTLISSSYE